MRRHLFERLLLDVNVVVALRVIRSVPRLTLYRVKLLVMLQGTSLLTSSIYCGEISIVSRNVVVSVNKLMR